MISMPSKNPADSGEKIAAFRSYQEAQAAVDYLSDRKFPVEHTAIIAENLKMVERVTGRRTILRGASLGAVNGIIIGMLIGFIFGLFNVVNPIFSGLIVAIYGAVLGLVLGAAIGLISYYFGSRDHDFTSDHSILAETYFLLVDSEFAREARGIMDEDVGGRKERSATDKHGISWRKSS